jgi:hypothetical protein
LEDLAEEVQRLANLPPEDGMAGMPRKVWENWGKIREDMENILENHIGKYNHRKIYRKIMGNIWKIMVNIHKKS